MWTTPQINMPVMSDSWIIREAQKGMITPFETKQVRKIETANGQEKGVISYGVSSYGYDFRIAQNFQIFEPSPGVTIDPKNINKQQFKTITEEDYLTLPPHTIALGQTMEYFRIPRDIITICFGKSTYARCGVLINVTPFEPEWEGFATLALSNIGNSPVRIYVGEGIGQLLFLQANEICNVSYRDKQGKYQAQTGITTARI